MSFATDAIRTLDQLREYVLRILCEKENLLAEQFRLQEIPIRRGDQTCGLQFLLRGPRQVQLAAVYASEARQVYFYDARGERFAKHPLTHTLND